MPKSFARTIQSWFSPVSLGGPYFWRRRQRAVSWSTALTQRASVASCVQRTNMEEQRHAPSSLIQRGFRRSAFHFLDETLLEQVNFRSMHILPVSELPISIHLAGLRKQTIPTVKEVQKLNITGTRVTQGQEK